MCDSECDPHELTRLIDQARKGDSDAENALCERVFHELYGIAKRLLPQAQGSIHATLLVQELWIRFFGRQGLKRTANRRYFFTVAADQMRRFLIDHYRHKSTRKAGGDRKREPFEFLVDQALDDFDRRSRTDFGALNEALEQLRQENLRLYEVVLHRYFYGRTIQATAEMMEVSESSIERDWRLARAKLRAAIGDPRE